jgi:hypothetical protein
VKTSRRSLAAVALVAVVGLSACTSDPSAKRVAQDLVNTVTMEPGGGGEKVRDCMLEVIDGYTTDELEALGNNAQSSDKAKAAEADKALKKFEADLAACR